MQLDQDNPNAGLCATFPVPIPNGCCAASLLKLPVTWFDMTKTTLYWVLKMRMQFAMWNISRDRRLASFSHNAVTSDFDVSGNRKAWRLVHASAIP